jgi:hypothetical protein
VLYDDEYANTPSKGRRMSVSVLVEKLRQFCLWFFWDRQWPPEKILTLVILILLVIILRRVTKQRVGSYAVKKARAAATEKKHWRTG